jgi:hypothetical protein
MLYAAASLQLFTLPGAAEAPPGRYTINDMGTAPVQDDTVRDNRTGLTWQRETPAAVPLCGNSPHCALAQANSYCAALTLAGGGFRVPTISELLTLLDPTRFGPGVDTAAFPGASSDVYWTTTVFLATTVHVVSFHKGETNLSAPTQALRVRCVR